MNVELILWIFGILIVCLITAVVIAFALIKLTAEINRDRYFETKKEIDNLTVKVNNIINQHNTLVDNQEENNRKFVKQFNKLCKIVNNPELMLIREQ